MARFYSALPRVLHLAPLSGEQQFGIPSLDQTKRTSSPVFYSTYASSAPTDMNESSNSRTIMDLSEASNDVFMDDGPIYEKEEMCASFEFSMPRHTQTLSDHYPRHKFRPVSPDSTSSIPPTPPTPASDFNSSQEQCYRECESRQSRCSSSMSNLVQDTQEKLVCFEAPPQVDELATILPANPHRLRRSPLSKRSCAGTTSRLYRSRSSLANTAYNNMTPPRIGTSQRRTFRRRCSTGCIAPSRPESSPTLGSIQWRKLFQPSDIINAPKQDIKPKESQSECRSQSALPPECYQHNDSARPVSTTPLSLSSSSMYLCDQNQLNIHHFQLSERKIQRSNSSYEKYTIKSNDLMSNHCQRHIAHCLYCTSFFNHNKHVQIDASIGKDNNYQATCDHARAIEQSESNMQTVTLNKRQSNTPSILPWQQFGEPFYFLEPCCLNDISNGFYNHMIDEIFIIDCRFSYEYEGGHIKGAINIWSQTALQSWFLKTFVDNRDRSSRRTVLIFHCEFSKNRAPEQFSCLRELDRRINLDNYPNLLCPEMYVIRGGYRAFHAQYPELCCGSYRKMSDSAFSAELEKAHNLRCQDVKRAKRFRDDLSFR